MKGFLLICTLTISFYSFSQNLRDSENKGVNISPLYLFPLKRTEKPEVPTSGKNKDRLKDFVIQKGGTVIDKKTGLQWMRCNIDESWSGKTCMLNEKYSPSFKWLHAKSLMSSYSGYFDWRLPTISELASLYYCDVIDKRVNPEQAKAFKSTPSYNFGNCLGERSRLTMIDAFLPNKINTHNRYWSSSYIGSLTKEEASAREKNNLYFSDKYYVDGYYYVYIFDFSFGAIRQSNVNPENAVRLVRQSNIDRTGPGFCVECKYFNKRQVVE